MDLIRDIKILKVYLNDSKLDLSDYFITGGCFRDFKRNLPYKDIDLYCKNEELYIKLVNYLKTIDKYPQETNCATTFNIPGVSVPVQIIRKITGTPKEVHEKFDFTINTSYAYLSEDINDASGVVWNEDYSLRVKDPLTPSTMLLRTMRFMGEGFSIEKSEMIKILEITKKAIENKNYDRNLRLDDFTGFYE